MTVVQRRVVDVAIIGAGPCGLGAAWQAERLRGRGAAISYVLLDENSAPGGSATSVRTPNGFLFDYGGHILYPHPGYADFAALLDATVPAWHESKPVRGVFLDGRLIPYPVQKNIHRLRTGKMLRSLAGLAALAVARRTRRMSAPAGVNQTLADYLLGEFGSGLTRHVMGPINRKMWACDPRALGSGWARQRSGSMVANIARSSVRQSLHSIVTRKDRLGWTDATRVRYPMAGGSGSIWDAIARLLPAARTAFGAKVVRIDAARRIVHCAGGEEIDYGHLVSSVPLDILIDVLDIEHLRVLKPRLMFASAAFVGFGIRGVQPAWLSGVHSFHMPEPDIPCWRVSFPGALSPGNAPDQTCWSILCEISYPSDEILDLPAAEAAIERGLKRRGILPAGAVVIDRWTQTLRHGYPVPFHGRDAALAAIQDVLRANNILSRGRFGGWKYEVSNQDHSFMQGVEAIDHIVDRRAEVTYARPASVNGWETSA